MGGYQDISPSNSCPVTNLIDYNMKGKIIEKKKKISSESIQYISTLPYYCDAMIQMCKYLLCVFSRLEKFT